MRAGLIAGAIALMLAGGATAQERDAPPPGCRWMGDDLGCRDGRGYYRRAGDGEIIGTYPVSRPKPKPAPRPRPAIAPEAPPSAQDVAAASATDAVAPAADAPFAMNEGGASPAAAATVAEPALAPPPPPEPAAGPPAAAPKPWWQAFWDWLVNDIMSLLRRLGLAK